MTASFFFSHLCHPRPRSLRVMISPVSIFSLNSPDAKGSRSLNNPLATLAYDDRPSPLRAESPGLLCSAKQSKLRKKKDLILVSCSHPLLLGSAAASRASSAQNKIEEGDCVVSSKMGARLRACFDAKVQSKQSQQQWDPGAFMLKAGGKRY